MKISRTFYDHDFPEPALDDKITLFEDRVLGWILEPAQLLADDVPHSGFAVLLIVSSYFEMVAKFREGYCRRNKSKQYFTQGLRWVFADVDFTDEECDVIYDEVRSGLYHAGITGPRVVLGRELAQPLSCTDQEGRTLVQVNPHTLPTALTDHFVSYVRQLRDRNQEDLRTRFESRFDWQGDAKRKPARTAG